MKSKIVNCFVSVLLMVSFWVMMCLGVVLNGNKSNRDQTGDTAIQQTTTTKMVESSKTLETKRTKQVTYQFEAIVTAYCPCEKCCNEWALNRPVDESGKEIVYTSSGTIAKQGRTVAADPSFYPYGTVLVIGGKEYVVEDCGGAIKGSGCVDVYFDNHEDAQEFGRKKVIAFVKG